MAGTFHERTQRLVADPGGGSAVGVITFDQVYAKYQHERTDLAHPRRGRAKYLESAVEDYGEVVWARVAADVLRGNSAQTFSRAVQDLAQVAQTRAPREFGELRTPGIRVTDRGRILFYKPDRRQSEREIERKRERSERRKQARRERKKP